MPSASPTTPSSTPDNTRGEGGSQETSGPPLFLSLSSRSIRYAIASRSSSRPSSRSSSRPIRLVVRLVSCVSLRRVVGSSRLFVSSCRFACRLVWAPFRPAIRSFSSCFSWRGCLAFPCRLVLPLASRLSYAPVIASRRLGSFSSVISFGLIRWRLMPVFMPVPRVRAVPFCSSLVPVRLFGFGSCPLSWGVAVRHGHDGGGGGGLLFSSHPSPHGSLLAISLTRCGMALWKDEA